MSRYAVVILALMILTTEACRGDSSKPLPDSPWAYLVPVCPPGFRQTAAGYEDPPKHPGRSAALTATMRRCEDDKFWRTVTVWSLPPGDADRAAVEWTNFKDGDGMWRPRFEWKPPVTVGFLRFEATTPLEQCLDEDYVRDFGCRWQDTIELQMDSIIVEITSVDNAASYSNTLHDIVGYPRWDDAEKLADEIIRRFGLGPAYPRP